MGGKASVWDGGGQQVLGLDAEEPSSEALFLSPGSIAVALASGEIRVQGAMNALLQGHKRMASGLSWNQDASLLASGSDDGTAVLWLLNVPVPSVSPHAILEGHSGCVVSVTWLTLPGTTVLATGSLDSTVRIWNSSGDCVTVLQLPAPVFCVATPEDCSLFAVGMQSGTIRVFSTQTFSVVAEYASEQQRSVQSLSFGSHKLAATWAEKDGFVLFDL
jgi:WD40 repeat protein